MEERAKIAIVDDLQFSRNFFAICVQDNPRWELVREFKQADQAVEWCKLHDVDLVLMDVMMSEGINGMTAAAQIKACKPRIKIVLATASAESKWIKEAKALGVESFWYKEYSDIKLQDVIARTLAGESMYPSAPPDLPFGDTTKSALTQRELDVLREMTAGFSNQEIADRLKISINTVRTHITNMINKTGFESRFDLALNAKALGVVVADSKKGE